MRAARTAVLSLAIRAVPLAALGGSNPAIRWRTIETPHFRVHHYQGGEDVARRVAGIAEEAYARCSDLFGLVPSQVVEVLVTDRVDAANGFATVHPYDRIEILAFPPEPESELASYDDWLRVLVYHEYTHVIHMDQVGGVPAAINRLLGKTMLPNGATNGWFVEGLATVVESRLTRGGRVGSSLFDMYLRSAALANVLLEPDRLTVTPNQPPRGSAPYLYGSYVLDVVYRRHGAAAITAFIRDYGRRVIPFALNHLARRHFGRDFFAIWAEFAAEQRERAARVADRVRTEGEVAGRRLTTNGEFNGYARFSPDSRRLYYVRSDARSREGVFEIDAAYGEARGAPRRIIDCEGGCGKLSADRDSIWTTHLDPWRIYHLYGDVFRVDPAAGTETRVTERARARDVSAGPGGLLYHVASEYDRVSIVARDLSTGRVSTVVPSGRFAGIGDPRPAPGTSSIVFSASAGGRWDLWTADTATGEVRPLTQDGCLDRDPEPTPDGRFVLFSTDRGGVYNVHALDLASGEVRRVTNVLGGAFWPAASPDGTAIAFSTWGVRGYDLAVLPYDPASWLRADPGADACRPTEAYAGPDQAAAALVAPGDRPYRAWPSVRPRSIRPLYRFSTVDDTRLGAQVSGFDAAGLHSWSLGADTRVTAFEPVAVAGYSYEGTFPSIGLSLATWPSREWVFVDDRMEAAPGRAWTVSPSAVLPIPLRDRSFAVSLSYALSWTTGLDLPRPTDPAGSRPSGPPETRDAAITVVAVHDSTRSFSQSISREEGFSAGASLTAHHWALGGQGHAVTVGAHFHQYLRMPWASGHVVALLASGALSRGLDRTEDRFPVGGFPPQDVFWAIVNHEAIGGRWLRGFRPGVLSGNTYGLLNVEYRAPLWYVHRGLDTLPLAARRLWVVAYADGGTASDGWPGRDDLRMGVGGELALSTSLFLAFNPVFRLGFARGIGPGGDNVFYLLVTP